MPLEFENLKDLTPTQLSSPILLIPPLIPTPSGLLHVPDQAVSIRPRALAHAVLLLTAVWPTPTWLTSAPPPAQPRLLPASSAPNNINAWLRFPRTRRTLLHSIYHSYSYLLAFLFNTCFLSYC